MRLRWEQHTEFQTYTFWRAAAAGAQRLDDTALAQVSTEWLGALPGEWLVGLHMLVTDGALRDDEASDAWARSLLDETSLVGAAVSEGAGPMSTPTSACTPTALRASC